MSYIFLFLHSYLSRSFLAFAPKTFRICQIIRGWDHLALSTWRNISYTRALSKIYDPRSARHYVQTAFPLPFKWRGASYLYRSINLSRCRRITACIFHTSIFPWQVAEWVSAFSRGTRGHLLRYRADKLTSLPEATAGQLCTQPGERPAGARAIARALDIAFYLVISFASLRWAPA